VEVAQARASCFKLLIGPPISIHYTGHLLISLSPSVKAICFARTTRYSTFPPSLGARTLLPSFLTALRTGKGSLKLITSLHFLPYISKLSGASRCFPFPLPEAVSRSFFPPLMRSAFSPKNLRALRPPPPHPFDCC